MKYIITLYCFYLLITGCSNIGNKPDNESIKKKLSDYEENFIYVKGGSFIMGNNKISNQLKVHKIPEHNVSVSDFLICKYEVTVNEFKQFVDETSYLTEAEKCDDCFLWTWNGVKSEKLHSDWKHDAMGKLLETDKINHPVTHITWNDATSYCKWLTRKYGKKFRLPTEAEWEFAASSRGNVKPYAWGSSLEKNIISGNISDSTTKIIWKDQDWFYLDYYNDGYLFTAPVGTFKPNEIGLYDMTGNVYEFCSDYDDEDYYTRSPISNPGGPKKGKKRVIRGGSFTCLPAYLKIWYRVSVGQNEIKHDLGFRVCISVN